MPDGEAQVVKPESPLVRIVEGKVLSYVEVHMPWAKHTVTIKSSPGNYYLNILNALFYLHGYNNIYLDLIKMY